MLHCFVIVVMTKLYSQKLAHVTFVRFFHIILIITKWSPILWTPVQLAHMCVILLNIFVLFLPLCVLLWYLTKTSLCLYLFVVIILYYSEPLSEAERSPSSMRHEGGGDAGSVHGAQAWPPGGRRGNRPLGGGRIRQETAPQEGLPGIWPPFDL